MDLTQEWKKFVEEKQEEKVKLFDELIKIDSDNWRIDKLIKIDGNNWKIIITNKKKKEQEDEQKKIKEMEKEEQENCDNNQSDNPPMTLFEIAAMIKDKPTKKIPQDYRQELIQNAPDHDPLSFFDLNRKSSLF